MTTGTAPAAANPGAIAADPALAKSDVVGQSALRMAFWARGKKGEADSADHDVAVAVGTSAQDAFTRMVKESLWPRLREVGFTGSGLTFKWPEPDAYMMIGLQKSTSSMKDSVKFTANVSVTTKARWAEMRSESSYLSEKPSPNTLPWGWGTRIGHLLPAGTDKWWELRSGESWKPIADEVLEAIEHYALPRMLSELAARR